MNYNISFSSFQETGQTGTKILLSLVQSPDETALNKQDDKVNLFLLKFYHKVFNTLIEYFWAWIFLLLKNRKYDW